ncbi:MAG: iron ABC transporter substrate-binding protein [Geminicoccaceae bacterium]|nr:MAG: iron ABC transporter substrate-binding protein [Geminicoccaceae bacterium]
MHLGKRLAVMMALGAFAGPAMATEITLYSGRGEALVSPLIAAFEKETGITVNVRYAGTSELAVLLQEEGERSPADLFWAQDAGALGAVASRFQALPTDLLERVPAAYRDREGRWIATSGRGRVLYYSTERVSTDELPASVFDLTDERYRGRVAWAPTNGSFQAFVTGMRVAHGDEVTRDWLQAMAANDARAFRNNTTQAIGIADGEVDFSLNNNYYLLRFLAGDANYPVGSTLFADDDIGNLLLVAGIGVLDTASQSEGALQFVEFLLSPQAQQYFTGQVFEYPVTGEVIENPALPSFEAVQASAPDVDLNDLDDLEGTLALLRDVGLL